MSAAVFCFEVWIHGIQLHEDPNNRRLVNHLTAGKAKAVVHRDLLDCYPSLPFTRMRARCVGKPRSSEQFKRNAKYRGMPDLECGDRVQLHNGTRGTITGHNASANFNVLYDADAPHGAGRVWNVHPADIANVESGVTK